MRRVHISAYQWSGVFSNLPVL